MARELDLGPGAGPPLRLGGVRAPVAVADQRRLAVAQGRVHVAEGRNNPAAVVLELKPLLNVASSTPRGADGTSAGALRVRGS